MLAVLSTILKRVKKLHLLYKTLKSPSTALLECKPLCSTFLSSVQYFLLFSSIDSSMLYSNLLVLMQNFYVPEIHITDLTLLGATG